MDIARLLLDITAEASGAGLGASLGGTYFISIIIMLAIFYFLLWRPQSKERKKMEAMLQEMEVGDFIVTTSGFYGMLIDITEEDVIVEFGSNKNCRISMRKSAIAQVEKPEKD